MYRLNGTQNLKNTNLNVKNINVQEKQKKKKMKGINLEPSHSCRLFDFDAPKKNIYYYYYGAAPNYNYIHAVDDHFFK